MSLISQEIKEFLDLQKLGYVATVSPEGKPNISPKGTIIGWTDDTLAFADIRSPDTMKNLETNPNIEMNVIDPLIRKGYLFSGQAQIVSDKTKFEEILNHYRERGVKSTINSIVLVKVSSVSEVTSPLYDLGATEDEIKLKWKKHFESL